MLIKILEQIIKTALVWHTLKAREGNKRNKTITQGHLPSDYDSYFVTGDVGSKVIFTLMTTHQNKHKLLSCTQYNTHCTQYNCTRIHTTVL